VTDTTKNQGAAPASGSATAFYLSPNTTINATDTLLGARQVGALVAGGSETVSTPLQIPDGLTPGTYYIIARADANATVPLPRPDPVPLEPGTGDPGVAIGGSGANGVPQFPTQLIAPVRHEASLMTRPDDLKPPYPESKILSGEEATLHLRLTISESGRVTAVDPVGAADRVFLEAARRHLIAHWRYRPATEDGRPIASSVVISLRFLLDG